MILITQTLLRPPLLAASLPHHCSSLSTCVLQPGDVLLKRQLTGRTIPTQLFGLFFTHSALYIGNGEIVEAQGYLANNADEIHRTSLYETEWNQENISEFIVLRPLLSEEMISTAIKFAIEIADDDAQRFGFSTDASVLSCAELIVRVYDNIVIEDGDFLGYVTPDDLWWYATAHPDQFAVVSSSLIR